MHVIAYIVKSYSGTSSSQTGCTQLKAQYNIEGVMRHANDLSSISAWVEEMKYNCLQDPEYAFV